MSAITDVSRARAMAQLLTNGFNVDPDVAVVATLRTGSVLPGGPNAVVNEIQEPIWHRRDYSATGQTKLSFLNEAQAPGITNLVQAGQIPTQTLFGLWGIGVDLVPALSRDGTIAGSGAGAQSSDAASTALDTAEQVRTILKLGTLQLKVNNQVIFQTTGLDKLPYAGGLDVSAAVATTETTTSMAAAITNNGAPFAANVRRITHGEHLLPGGISIACDITWPAAVALTGGGYLELVLYGTKYWKS